MERLTDEGDGSGVGITTLAGRYFAVDSVTPLRHDIRSATVSENGSQRLASTGHADTFRKIEPPVLRASFPQIRNCRRISPGR
jgi:hypothetical protein